MRINKLPDDEEFLKYTSIPLTGKPKEYKEYHQIKQFLEDKKNKAAGLAAVQIGSHIRLFGVKIAGIPGFRSRVMMFANPQYLFESESLEYGHESCLSEPGITAHIERSKHITVSYYDGDWTHRSTNLMGFNARVFQHEMDHLNGILLSDIKEK